MGSGIGLRLIRKNRTIGYKLLYIYYFLFKRNRLQQKKEFSNQNTDRTVYIVKPDTEDGVEGLLSLLSRASLYIRYAQSKDYLVYVDWKNFKTQYYDGQNNAWEFFFEQPSTLTEIDAYNSNNIYLSGWTWKDINLHKCYSIEQFFNKKLNRECHNLINTIKFNHEVLSLVQKEGERIHIEDCIGLYIRGTDYVGLKPSGEHVQPTVEQTIPVIKTFLEKYKEPTLYLVTEDGTIYDRINQEFPDKLVIVSYDNFIYDYKGKTFLSMSNVLVDDKRKRGVDYLVKMILLSKCKYLISSITMGSMFSYALNGNHYEDEYIFDLGLYP